MENILDKFGFKKDGLYSWNNGQFNVVIYFNGITITKVTGDNEETLYDSIIPVDDVKKINLIEKNTGLKIVHKTVVYLLDSTKSNRIYSNTSLYISNLLINYFKYNNVSEDIVCKKLNISKHKLKEYLSGTYDFNLSELSNISVLVSKTIVIK